MHRGPRPACGVHRGDPRGRIGRRKLHLEPRVAIVRRRMVGTCDDLRVEGGVLHPERSEDLRLHCLLVRNGYRLLWIRGVRCHVAGGSNHGIGVLVCFAIPRRGLELLHPFEHRLGGYPLEVDTQVVVGNARARTENVAHGELLRELRIAESKARQDRRHVRVPGELPLIHERGHHQRGEGFRHGCDSEHRVRSDRVLLPKLLHPKTLFQDHPGPLHDCYSEPWNLRDFPTVFDERLEFVEPLRIEHVRSLARERFFDDTFGAKAALCDTGLSPAPAPSLVGPLKQSDKPGVTLASGSSPSPYGFKHFRLVENGNRCVRSVAARPRRREQHGAREAGLSLLPRCRNGCGPF